MAKGTDVIIVGAGIIGTCAAFYLNRHGLKTTLLDAFHTPFQGSTSAGFGSLTPYSDPFFSGETCTFAQRGVDLYRDDMLPALRKATGRQIHLSEDEMLQVFESTAAQTAFEKKARKLKKDLSIYRQVSRSEIARLEPELTREVVGGIVYPEPWIDIQAFLLALEVYLRKSGLCDFQLGAAAVKVREARTSTTVTLSNGTTLTGSTVLIATGVSAIPIKGIVRPKIEWIRGDAILAGTAAPLVKRHVYMGDGFVTPRLDGTHLLGATYEEDSASETMLAHDERETARLDAVQEILRNTTAIIPRLSQCNIVRMWHGWRPATPNGKPAFLRVPNTDRVWAALGFIGLGITMAPAVGEAFSEVVLGGKVRIPPDLSNGHDKLWTDHG